MIEAIRERRWVLTARGLPVKSVGLCFVDWVPEPILVFAISCLLDTRFVEMGMAGHADATRDEMKLLADEFGILAGSTSVPTPAADSLYDYVDPVTSGAGMGSARIPPRWRRVSYRCIHRSSGWCRWAVSVGAAVQPSQ